MLRNASVCLLLCCGFTFQVAAREQFSPSLFQEMHWRMIGPFRGGRTRAVAGVPNQPNTFYIGAVNGGVWKSDDYGRTWKPIFDQQPTQSIGAIAVAASDPNIVYVASGEGLHRPDLSVGNGIYKSSDGGKTWTHLGLRGSQQIPALVVDPRDPNRLFAAVLGHPYGASEERGIFRSTDGGQRWQKILYKDANTGASDIEMDPSDPHVLYAALWEAREGPWEDNNIFNGAGGGLFKSTDSGDTWRQLKKGLPQNLAQINVAIAASNPKRLYATVGTIDKGTYGSDAGLGVYRSDDAGDTWYAATSDPRPAMRIGGGDLPVPRVDPTNAGVVYSASLVVVRSSDGGKTWNSLRGAPGGDDYQNLWINPSNGNILIVVSDQGAIVSVNGGDSWSSWYNQPTAQLYHVSTTDSFPYKVCGGQQESGSVCILSRGNDGEITFRDWHPVGTIEYGYVAPDPLDPDVIYGAGRNEVSKFHWSTGQVENVTPIPVRDHKYRVDRTEPIVFSPLDPHTLYYAANVLFNTRDGGNTWQTISPDLTRPEPAVPASVGALVPKAANQQRGVIYSLAPSFRNSNTLWAGTDDGLIWITRDGGKNWSNITPPELTPWSKVTQIQSSHFDDQTAYASVSRLRIDDLHPYIYRTHDGGKNWQSISTGLPDGPADTIREDQARKGLLFAGTENAVWVSFDDGDDWQSLELNLPHTSMRDLAIHGDDLIVSTHGRSFWILDDISPLRQLSQAIASAEAYLFKPADANRVHRDTNTDTPLPPDEPAGQNPPSGAIIDYFLAHAGPVTLEILDAQGKLVRQYASTDQPELTRQQLEKQLIPLYWTRPAKALPSEAGMHRWVWDLHHSAPLSTRRDYPISAIPHDTPRAPFGPRALPGQYKVRLTTNGQIYTAPLMVHMDPRVRTSAAALAQQFQLETRLAGMMNQIADANLRARSTREQFEALLQKASGSTAAAIRSLQQKLTALLAGVDQPGNGETPTLATVNSTVNVLYEQVSRADAAPTAIQASESTKLETAVTDATRRWHELESHDLPILNQKLKGAGLQEVRPEATVRDQPEEGDEE